jgi:DNA-binding beta-propeller fold protein YncE
MASAMPVISPDGKYVYFAEQVMEAWLGVPDGKIYVYDADTEDSIAVIEYEGISQPCSFIITDDSKYMMVDPVNEFEDETSICLINAQTFQVIGVYDFHDLPGCITSKWAAHGGGNYRL